MGLSKKGWVVLTTVIFISLIFIFYFLVYVKGNESKIIENNLRVLAKMKDNITNLMESEEKIAENWIQEIKSKEEIKDLVIKLNDVDSLSEIDTVTINEIINKTYPDLQFSNAIPETHVFQNPNVATWNINNNYIFKKPYQELFKNDLIERKDIFEFIAISTFKNEKLTTIYSNFPLGNINYPQDSTTLANFTSKNLFEIDFGHNQYQAFNAQMDGDGKYEVYLTGFVNKARFNEKKREVSVFFITFAIILTILLILAFPILKLRVMNNEERLNRKDVFFIGISMVIGPSLLILFFLFFSSHLLSDKPKEKQKLEKLNETLTKNFNTELKNAIDQLKVAKTKLPNGFAWGDSLEIHKEKMEANSGQEQFIINNALEINGWDKNFRYFNSIFWTDPLGNLRIYLSSEKEAHQIRSLNHRKYVMDIANGNHLDYNGNSIAIESIRSVSDGNYEIGLGMVSGNKNLPVLAASFSLASLMNPILEEGYGFCLFNSEGRTLFHSEIKRNLNENFLDETAGVLTPYLISSLSHHTAVSYMDKDHYMYLNKLSDLDGYFMATFVEKAYTHSPNAVAINMTIEMQLAFFTLLFLLYLVLYASALKRSKLKQRVFLFNWLKPFTGFEGANKYLYLKLLGINGLVFTYMLINWGIFFHSPDLLIQSILCSGMLLIGFHFWKLSKALPDNERMYTQFHDKGNLGFIGLIIGLVVLFLFLVKIYLLKYYTFLGVIDLAILGLTAYGIYRILKLDLEKQDQKKIISFFKNKRLLDYKFFVLSLIVLFSILPTLMFFSLNYKKEKEILFKYKTLALKQKKDNWKDEKKAQFYQSKNGAQESIIQSLDVFIENMEVSNLNDVVPSSLKYDSISQKYRKNPESFLYDELYGKARIEFDSYGINSQGFIKNGDSTNWAFVKGGIDFYYPNKSNRIIGPPMTFTPQECMFILIFLIIIVCFIFGILKNVINKIFGLDFKDYAEKLVLNKPFKEIANKLISVYDQANSKKDSFNNSFIVGVNASHVYEIKEILRNWKKDNFFSMDLLDLPNVKEVIAKNTDDLIEEYFTNSSLNFQILIKNLVKSNNHNDNYLIKALNDKHELPNSSLMVFIEHFEFSYDNLYLNKVKLNILQRLVTNPSIRVVISSEISPIKIYEFYEDSIKKMESIALKCKDYLLENREKIEEVKTDYKNWLHLLGGFFRITIPLEKNYNEEILPILNEELKHGEYLDRINNKFEALFRKKDSGNYKTPNLEEDDFILNIQETSYSYYFAIWNSLSKEERYIVYDIAHDGFVNTNNVDGIIDLLQKGLLIYDHSLRLMNESFTNFVLTKVNSDEALERELESSKGGKWNTVSAVILLIIISLVVFISFGKINMLEDVNALLGSLAAIFTLLLRMSGIFVLGKSSD